MGNRRVSGTSIRISDVIKNSEFYKSHGLYSNLVVIQPTAFCNIDCKYCYLPDRTNRAVMDEKVAYRVAASINEPTTILWHSGEPTATGLEKFMKLMKPFKEIQEKNDIGYSIQTNATLLTNEWAEYLKNNNFNVGVSIDGPKNLNSSRVFRSGIPAYNKIIRGVQTLKSNNVPFSILVVVREDTSGCASEIYNFATDLGAQKLGVNFEEVEGIHSGGGFKNYKIARKFWSDLYDSWKNNPVIPVREFLKIHDRLNRTIVENDFPPRHSIKNPINEVTLLPTIAVNGDVTLFSPEFVGVKKFVVGNILKMPLEEIIEKGLNSWFVQDFSKSLKSCKKECKYFDYCGGGFPSNRYSEHGKIDIRETNHCIVHDQALIDLVLEKL